MVEQVASHGDTVVDAVRLLRTLSDPTRLRLLGVLQRGEHNVTDLCRELRLPQPTVSHHLGLLRSAGLVANRREGKQVYYSRNGTTVLLNEPDQALSIETGSLQLQIRRP